MNQRDHPGGSLVVVGFGITTGRHLTHEGIEAIKQADAVLYVVNGEPAQMYLTHLNSTAESLADCYGEEIPRAVSYQRMVSRIVDRVRQGLKVSAVFYGHPGVLAQPAHAAVAAVRRLGLSAHMQAGIGADACLFADLGINPGERGCQSYEATSFLCFRKRIDPTSDLILWQVGLIGVPTGGTSLKSSKERVARLVARLRQHFPDTHRVTLYSASPHAFAKRVVRTVALGRLVSCRMTPATTLFVPGLKARTPDPTVVRWLTKAVCAESRASAASDRIDTGGAPTGSLRRGPSTARTGS